MSLLEVNGLNVGFRTGRGVVQALSDASFSLNRGESLLIIGESGSGKTVLAHALLRLLPMNTSVTGEVLLDGRDLLTLREEEMRRVRGRRVALIPQGAGSALNPVRRIGSILMESALARGLTQAVARERLTTVLAELGLAFDQVADRYPHQLSGGMQQRVINALALVGQPELVIADEPTFGLDTELVETTAAQLEHIRSRGIAVLVITHHLRLAQRLGGRLALLYASYIVELRDTAAFFDGPAHPYGRALLNALPERGAVPIPGVSPELTALPMGCSFAERCVERREGCDAAVPAGFPLNDQTGWARCFLHAGG
jgi:peptide/nickel transport system ATP-binding protein